MDTNIMAALLAPVVTAVVGAVGILTRDLYNRRSERGRRKFAMDDATRQVSFATEWWKAKQALGSTSDDQAARAMAESWLAEATTRVSEVLHAPRRPDRSLTRRLLLAYPFQRRAARLLKVIYYLLLANTAIAVFSAIASVERAIEGAQGETPGQTISITVFGIITYGFLTFTVRAWAVSIENRLAKQRTSTEPFAPLGGLTAPQPGWYPDPSGAPGQRYWDGQQWIAVAPRTT